MNAFTLFELSRSDMRRSLIKCIKTGRCFVHISAKYNILFSRLNAPLFTILSQTQVAVAANGVDISACSRGMPICNIYKLRSRHSASSKYYSDVTLQF